MLNSKVEATRHIGTEEASERGCTGCSFLLWLSDGTILVGMPATGGLFPVAPAVVGQVVVTVRRLHAEKNSTRGLGTCTHLIWLRDGTNMAVAAA